MINDFEFYRFNDKGFTSLSSFQVSKMISKFNIYFKTYCSDLPLSIQDEAIYKVDGLKDFDSQYFKIKSIHFPYECKVLFYTDNLIDTDCIYALAKSVLKNMKDTKQKLTLTNFKKFSKIKDIAILNDVLLQDKSYLQGEFSF